MISLLLILLWLVIKIPLLLVRGFVSFWKRNLFPPYKVLTFSWTSFFLFLILITPFPILFRLIFLRIPLLSQGWNYTSLGPWIPSLLWWPSIAIVSLALFPYVYVFLLVFRNSVILPWKSLANSFFILGLGYPLFRLLMINLHKFSFRINYLTRGQNRLKILTRPGKFLLLFNPHENMKYFYLFLWLSLALGEILLHPGYFFILPYYSFYLLLVSLFDSFLFNTLHSNVIFNIGFSSYLYGFEIVYPKNYRFYEGVYRSKGLPCAYEGEIPPGEVFSETDPQEPRSPKIQVRCSWQAFPWSKVWTNPPNRKISMKGMYYGNHGVRWTHTSSLGSLGVQIPLATKVKLALCLNQRKLTPLGVVALWRDEPMIYDWIEYIQGKKIFPTKDWGLAFKSMLNTSSQFQCKPIFANRFASFTDAEALARLTPRQSGILLRQAEKKDFSLFVHSPRNQAQPDGVLVIQERGFFIDAKRPWADIQNYSQVGRGGILAITPGPKTAGQLWRENTPHYLAYLQEKNIDEDRIEEIQENLQAIGQCLEEHGPVQALEMYFQGMKEGLYDKVSIPTWFSPGVLDPENLTQEAREELDQETLRLKEFQKSFHSPQSKLQEIYPQLQEKTQHPEDLHLHGEAIKEMVGHIL